MIQMCLGIILQTFYFHVFHKKIGYVRFLFPIVINQHSRAEETAALMLTNAAGGKRWGEGGKQIEKWK